MTLFRKYYKEANDDIKPREEFVNSVISKAKAHKPPRRIHYVRYASLAAAAVAVVSAAVISMPLWNRVDDARDGIIIEETSVTSPQPSSAVSGGAAKQGANAEDAAQPVPSAAPKQDTKSAETAKSSQPKNNYTSEHSFSTPNTEKQSAAPLPQSDAQPEVKQEQQNTAEEKTEPDTSLKSEVMDNSENDIELYMAMGAAPSAAKKVDASESAATENEAIEDATIPTPSGYYCTRAEWNGYTFKNDEGAVIIVSVSYGESEASAPYYEQDGDNIYATYAAYGMTVTVNASGADMSTVKEIINSLR